MVIYYNFLPAAWMVCLHFTGEQYPRSSYELSVLVLANSHPRASFPRRTSGSENCFLHVMSSFCLYELTDSHDWLRSCAGQRAYVIHTFALLDSQAMDGCGIVLIWTREYFCRAACSQFVRKHSFHVPYFWHPCEVIISDMITCCGFELTTFMVRSSVS